MALHGAKGVFSFAKENTPFISPRERLALRAFGSKGCTRRAVEVRCTWLRHESLRFDTSINRAHSVARV